MICEYFRDKKFVAHIHDMANKYDSEFLRNVADRMNFIIKERKANGEYNGFSGQNTH